MSDLYLKLLLHVSNFIILIPIILGVLSWQKKPYIIRFFVIYFILYFVIFLCSMKLRLGAYQSIFNVIIAFIDCIVFLTLYYFNSERYKRLFLVSCIVVCLGLIIDYTLNFGNGNSSFLSLTFKNVVMLALSLLILVEWFSKVKINTLYSVPIFIISITKLILVCYSMLFDAIRPLLVKEYLNIFLIMYTCDLLFHGIGNLTYAFAIYKGSKRKIA
jgi:hypothetical protein